MPTKYPSPAIRARSPTPSARRSPSAARSTELLSCAPRASCDLAGRRAGPARMTPARRRRAAPAAESPAAKRMSPPRRRRRSPRRSPASASVAPTSYTRGAMGHLGEAPARMPCAAAAANAAPWSSASSSAMGPEVNGSPTSRPLTSGPQRRPTSEIAAISTGVRVRYTVRFCSRRYLWFSRMMWVSDWRGDSSGPSAYAYRASASVIG